MLPLDVVEPPIAVSPVAVVVPRVAIIVPRCRAACCRHCVTCRPDAPCCRRAARRRAAPCRRCAARLVARHCGRAAHCRRRAVSSYRPSPSLCRPSPFCPLPSSCRPSLSSCGVVVSRVVYQFGIFGRYSVGISPVLPIPYQRKTRLVHFGIKKGAVPPFFLRRGAMAPFLRTPTPFWKKGGKKGGKYTKKGGTIPTEIPKIQQI